MNDHMIDTLSKFRRDPIGLLERAFLKIFIAPLKYRSREGYDARRYWHDRFAHHGLSLRSVGDEGLSEKDNEKMYQKAAQALLALCQRENVDLTNSRTLEIGCGNGFYAQLLAERGMRRYVGMDITDVFFPALKKRHPDFEFIRKDITADKLNGEFDLILMIDVIEHITSPNKLSAAFENVKNCLAKGGVFMVAPVPEKGKHSLFYVRFWSLKDITKSFMGFEVAEPVPFRYDRLLVIRKP